MSLSKCINTLENSRWMKNTSDPDLMDIPELSSPEVSVETTKPKKKRINKKFPNPKFYKRLIQCLDDEEYTWMLRYVPGSYRKEFEVIFTDRKNKKVWKEDDIALFVKLDKYIENIFKRKRSTKKYEEEVKIRFKSNMCKCVARKFIEKVDEKKEGKCKTVKRYKILWRPPPTVSVGEPSGNNGNGKKSKGKENNRKENKKMEMDRNGPMDSTLENLANLFLDDDMKMDENENRDSKITLENVKISFPIEDFDEIFYYELNAVETSGYLNKPYPKIGNNTLDKVAVANASNQKTNTFCENSDDYTNASGQKQIYTFFGNLDAYTKPEYETLSQENQVLKSDPFLCSASKGYQAFFNSLGDSDWLGTYQPLKPMELNEGWEQVLETRN